MVSDELVVEKRNAVSNIYIIPSINTTQADCPHVTDIVTASINDTSSQFRVEEFPASSEILELNSLQIHRPITQNGVSKFTVQPVPAPCSTNELANSKMSEGGSNQKLILFNRGKAISGAPISTGTK